MMTMKHFVIVLVLLSIVLVMPSLLQILSGGTDGNDNGTDDDDDNDNDKDDGDDNDNGKDDDDDEM